jgi:diguanylate cyclase (GGDEF)-like protein
VLELPHAGRDHLVRLAPVRDGGGVVAGLLVAHDLTDRKLREHRLAELVSRDSLTGVSSRRRLRDELDWLLGEVARGRGEGGVLLLVDLDGFKSVNDTLGHEAGDRLLRSVAEALQRSVRRTDLVARLGGDEFAVLLPGATPTEARRVSEKIALAVQGVWPLQGRGGASIGAAEVGGGSWTATRVLEQADRAMYEAKRERALSAAC